MNLVELPWAHSKHHDEPLPERTVWINPDHVVAVMPAKDAPNDRCFVSTSNNKGHLLEMTAAAAASLLAGGS